MREVSLAISPCPNDTFAFYHFIHSPALRGRFRVVHPLYADIQQLNELALAGDPDIVKVSFLVAGELLHSYDLLPSGGAIGYGVGPLLLAPPWGLQVAKGQSLRVGLPGKNTSAHLLFEYYANHTHLRHSYGITKQHMLFSEVMQRLQDGSLDLGVVIHEGRFVYQAEGLQLQEDLGAFWERNSGYPVPLGAILVRKTLSDEIKEDIRLTLRKSIERAMASFTARDSGYMADILPFVARHAQELSPGVMEAHISTYVTQETIELSQQALAGVQFFWQQGKTLLAGS